MQLPPLAPQAQGVYFSANAKRHCRALAASSGPDAPPPSHEDEAKSRVRFAGFFAVIFPFGITAFKVGSGTHEKIRGARPR